MTRSGLSGLLSLLVLSSCSSVGVYDLQKRGATVRQAPSAILVEPFTAAKSALRLGPRSEEGLRALRTEIVSTLATRTSAEIRTYAANSSVISANTQPRPGTWLLRGEILKVDQGSRALRAAVGLGVGRTKMRTRVTLCEVTADGRQVPILSFNTTGSSGIEPGVALGVATGGASLIGTGGGLVAGGLPGVSTDIDRTAYEIAAVLSAYLDRNGLLDPSRRAISPNMKGRLPTSVNASRAIPAPLRSQN